MTSKSEACIVWKNIRFLPDGAVRILVKADLETIKERFKARMRGNLPTPVAQMLERNHGHFDQVEADYEFDGAHGSPDALCEQVMQKIEQESAEH